MLRAGWECFAQGENASEDLDQFENGGVRAGGISGELRTQTRRGVLIEEPASCVGELDLAFAVGGVVEAGVKLVLGEGGEVVKEVLMGHAGGAYC